ncbi:MAG: FtsQ-type POTRA domain-containing protein [Gemmatimonadales bacterium]|nr:FtsQ-type POTRA domain-containing protein [Gemmatimonadales bacterium]
MKDEKSAPGRSDGSTVGGAGTFAVRRKPARSRKQFILPGVGAVVILALAAWCVIWLRTADTFSIVRVETGSYRFTSEGDLEKILSGFLGQNIWTLSNTEMEQAMSALPWVRDLRLRRRLPAIIEVDFREWRPLLEVAGVGKDGSGAGEVSWVLVEDGRVLPFPGHLVLAGLPVLMGVACVSDEGSGPLALDPEDSSLVMALLSAMNGSGLESVSPVDFVVARPEGFAIVLQDDLGTLLVGREEFRDRLQRYMEAHGHLEPGLIVDLRFKDRVTCRRPDPDY